MKRLIIEIMIIVIVSSAIGIAYNFFTQDPLPLVRKPAIENAFPDSILYSNSYKVTEKDLEKSITYDQMLKLKDSDDFILIDARRPDQFAKGKIGNAINIHPEYEDEQAYVQSIFSIPQDKTIIIYCDGGTCDLSHKLAKELLGFGFKAIFIYHGGWEEWIKSNPKA